MNIQNQSQIQTVALAGATLVSALHSAKSLVQVFIGTDSVATRVSNWSVASKQEDYLGAVSKRVQFFTGSDSLSTRITQLFKGLFVGAASIVMCDLITTNSGNSSKFQAQSHQLTLINTAGHDAKAAAGAYIDACCTENVCDDVANLINCMAKAFPAIQKELGTATNNLQTCFNLKTGLESQMKLDSALYNTCKSDKSTALEDAQTAQATVSAQEGQIIALEQQIQALRTNIEKADARNSNFTMTISELGKDLKQLTELKAEVNSLKPLNAKLYDQVTTLQTEVATLKNNHARALEAAKAQAKTELDARQADLDTCNTALASKPKEKVQG